MEGIEGLVIEFEREKETPGTVRFKEIEQNGSPPSVGTLYIKKYVEISKSERLRVTVKQV